MEIIYTPSQNSLRITLIGELDECSAADTRASIDDTLSKNLFQKIVFDMSRLTFMDSTGIGVLVGRFKTHGKKIMFTIASPTQAVDKILKLSGIYTIMPKQL